MSLVETIIHPQCCFCVLSFFIRVLALILWFSSGRQIFHKLDSGEQPYFILILMKIYWEIYWDILKFFCLITVAPYCKRSIFVCPTPLLRSRLFSQKVQFKIFDWILNKPLLCNVFKMKFQNSNLPYMSFVILRIRQQLTNLN